MTLNEKLDYIDRDIDNYIKACKERYGDMPDTIEELKAYMDKVTDSKEANEWISKYEAHGDKPRNSCFEYLTNGLYYKMIAPISLKMQAIEAMEKRIAENEAKFKAFREEYINKVE